MIRGIKPFCCAKGVKSLDSAGVFMNMMAKPHEKQVIKVFPQSKVCKRKIVAHAVEWRQRFNISTSGGEVPSEGCQRSSPS